MTQRKCLRCKGYGRISLASGALEKSCFVCQGAGFLSPPDIQELRALIISREGLRTKSPFASYKIALGMVGKPGPWGHIPGNVDEATDLWRATIIGRRSNYVWTRAREQLGLVKTRHRAYAVEGTRNDPFQPELEQLIAEIVQQEKAK